MSKGILIPPIVAEDEYALLEVRRALEVTSVRLACSRQRPEHAEQLCALRQRLAGDIGSLRDYAGLMGEVHHLIASAAGNACLSDAIARLQSLSRRYWYHHVRDAASEMATGARLLRGIVDAVLARDPERAARASIALNNYLVDSTHAVAAPPRRLPLLRRRLIHVGRGARPQVSSHSPDRWHRGTGRRADDARARAPADGGVASGV